MTFKSSPPALQLRSEQLRTGLTDCISAIQQWTDANWLSLNPSKTEFLWLSTPRRSHLISYELFTIDGVDIIPKTELHLLGVLLDENLSLIRHVDNVTRTCFYHLQRIKSVCRYLLLSDAIKLARALARID